MWIVVEGGDVFEGDEEQFDDCFGMTASRPIPEELIRDFCKSQGWSVTIRPWQVIEGSLGKEPELS